MRTASDRGPSQSPFRRVGRGLLQRTGNRLLAISREMDRSPQAARVAAWRAVNGEGHRLDYELSPDSIVLDVGGFRGDWAAEVAARFGCTIHIFEPVPQHQALLVERFGANPRIHVHPFGLGALDETVAFDVDGARSSELAVGGTRALCEIRQAAAALEQLGLTYVDLVKINIEGGEFTLVPHLIDTGWIHKLAEMTIQWHDFVPDAQPQMKAIQQRLEQTHVTTYSFPFVWENWRRLGS
ncbi:MAG: FkbM family methyltransferase [Glaciecola sp.]